MILSYIYVRSWHIDYMTINFLNIAYRS